LPASAPPAAPVTVLAVFALLAWVALGTMPSVEARIFAPVSVPFATLAPVTARFFSCFVPTLLAGSAVAAYAAPPSAGKARLSP
jgi:hypothetical protein